mgnify:CR=1 FL=1
MRYEDWPERLDAKLREWEAIPFVWGKTDCVAFIRDVVRALTGKEITNRSDGTYGTEFGALRAIKNYGDDLEESVTLRFGEPIPVLFAQRGDILLDKNNLGICIGTFGAFRGIDGIVEIPLSDCAAAWRCE